MKKPLVFLKKNLSTPLSIIGAMGVVATSVSAVKATPKAILIIEREETLKGESLTKTEIVKATASVYIPALAIGLSTIACIFGANALNKRQQAVITSAYALLEQSFKEYREKVKELYGEDSDRDIGKAVAKGHLREQSYSNDNEQLFYDFYSKRYFKSTMTDVIKAEYEFNRFITTFGNASINDFYDILDNPDLPKLKDHDNVGWSTVASFEFNGYSWIDFINESMPMDDGTECIAIITPVPPTVDYYTY